MKTAIRRICLVEDVITYIERIKTCAPKIGLYCECFHYETRTRWVTEYYTEYEYSYDYVTKTNISRTVQKSRQKMETYQEKVVSYNEKEQFQFARCEDVSGLVSDEIYRFQATKIDFDKLWYFGDERTEGAYKAQKHSFVSRNRNRDSNFYFIETYSIDGFQDKMLSIVDMKHKSPLMNWVAYIGISMLLASWPYRVWLERESAKGKFIFKKKVFV